MASLKKDKHLSLKQTAPPNQSSIALVLTVGGLCLWFMPSWSHVDEYATVEAFSTSHFSWISMKQMAWTRLSFAAIGFFLTFSEVLFQTMEVTPSYRPHSKLHAATMELRGIRMQAYFTKWAWNLLSLSFLLSGSIAWLSSEGYSDYLHHPNNRWILRIALLSFETAAPTEFLVAAVVKYAIWPQLIESNVDTAGLKTFKALMMHNGCVFMLLVEVALFGGIPITMSHFPVAPLFGLSYIVFAWYMSNKWNPQAGPQFLYFFLDTTLGKESTIALGVLLFVLVTFFVFFWVADDLIEHLPGIPGRFALAAAVSGLVCRFRD